MRSSGVRSQEFRSSGGAGVAGVAGVQEVQEFRRCRSSGVAGVQEAGGQKSGATSYGSSEDKPCNPRISYLQRNLRLLHSRTPDS